MLCDYSDDKSQYASFLQKTDPYATYISHKDAAKLSRDSGKGHVTSFHCPRDLTEGPDVVYSPPGPKDCEACSGNANAATTAAAAGGHFPASFLSQSKRSAGGPGAGATTQSGNTLGKYRPPLQPVLELDDYRNNAENATREQAMNPVVSLWYQKWRLFLCWILSSSGLCFNTVQCGQQKRYIISTKVWSSADFLQPPATSWPSLVVAKTLLTEASFHFSSKIVTGTT